MSASKGLALFDAEMMSELFSKAKFRDDISARFQTFREFYWLVFCMPWARILLLFEAFATVFQSQISR